MKTIIILRKVHPALFPLCLVIFNMILFNNLNAIKLRNLYRLVIVKININSIRNKTETLISAAVENIDIFIVISYAYSDLLTKVIQSHSIKSNLKSTR